MIEAAYRYRATVVKAHDGDTYELNVDLGFRVYARLMVRLHGYSCPELNQPDGVAARDAAIGLCAAAKQIVIQSYKDQQSFARWVADVYVDGEHLGELLLRRGLAVVGAKVGT